MEVIVSPVILILVLRFGFSAIITWFFEKIVEPKAELARQQRIPTAAASLEPTNAQKIATARKGLDELKGRM